MKKLTFDELIIEPTRRCNMIPPCKHCGRGKPQAVDLAFEDIDALLNQTDQIYNIQFTGGEPFCNTKALEYILAQLKERKIHIWSMQMFSNGLAPIEALGDIMARYADYIGECRRVDGVDTKKALTMLYISVDAYHAHGAEVEAKINELAKILDGRAHVIRSDVGNRTAATGLAIENLDRSKLIEPPQGRKAKQQIAIHDATQKPACMLYESFPLRRPDQVIVQCPVALTTRGNLISASIAGTYEYFAEDDPDNIICHVSNTDSIYDAIFAYNTGKFDCFDYQISFMNNPETPGRMKAAYDFQTKMDDLDKQVLRQEPEEDESIFPIPESLSPFELNAIIKMGLFSREDRIRIANEVRARIQQWDGVSVPSKLDAFLRRIGIEAKNYMNLFKQLGVEERFENDIRRLDQKRKQQRAETATKHRIDGVKAKADADMAAIQAIWAAQDNKRE